MYGKNGIYTNIVLPQAARQAFHEACDSKTVDEKLSQQFAYAKLLISSPKKDHIVEGLGLMAGKD